VYGDTCWNRRPPLDDRLPSGVGGATGHRTPSPLAALPRSGCGCWIAEGAEQGAEVIEGDGDYTAHSVHEGVLTHTPAILPG